MMMRVRQGVRHAALTGELFIRVQVGQKGEEEEAKMWGTILNLSEANERKRPWLESGQCEPGLGQNRCPDEGTNSFRTVFG